MSRIALRRALLSAALLVPVALTAQKPTAQSLFDKHAAAVGGVAAFRALAARTESGTADITFANISAGYERKAMDGKVLMVIDIPSFGQIQQGFDGSVAWAMDPQQGARKLDAGMTADAAANSSFTAGFFEPGTYATAEVLDATDFAGKRAWPVKITGKTGRIRTVYYDQASGLKLGEETQGSGAASKVLYDDYKPFGAVRLPTKVTQVTPNGDIVITITAVTFDPIAASVFVLPDEVKKLP